MESSFAPQKEGLPEMETRLRVALAKRQYAKPIPEWPDRLPDADTDPEE
jgi:hypothetical protein